MRRCHSAGLCSAHSARCGPPVAVARRVAAAVVVGAGPALPGHVLQEAGQAGTAALAMLVAAQGLHTAEGLGLGG